MGKYFSDVCGQKRAVSILTSHLLSGNISHAYLFLGEEGIGKEYLAREFSRYILCDSEKDDECESCRKFKRSSHPDFIFVDGKEGIKIEDIRNVIERINLSPGLSERKVLLLSKIENIGIEAANALLKTLEEPPLDSVIIMTSNSEKRLPETIVSRTQQIKLSPLSVDNIIKILGKEYAEADIKKIIKLSDGNIGEAKKLILDGESYAEKENLKNDIELIMSSKSIIDKFKILEEYEKKKSIKMFTDNLLKALVSGIYAKTLKKKAGLASIIPENLSPIKLTQISKKILKIYQNLDYNVSLRIALEKLILEEFYA